MRGSRLLLTAVSACCCMLYVLVSSDVISFVACYVMGDVLNRLTGWLDFVDSLGSCCAVCTVACSWILTWWCFWNGKCNYGAFSFGLVTCVFVY